MDTAILDELIDAELTDRPLPARTDLAAEMEAAWVWTDQLDGYGDQRPDGDRTWLSATHGS